MKLRYETETSRFIFDCTFYEKDIAKSAGFRWNPTEKLWWTDDILKAARLKDEADTEAAKVISEQLAEKEAKISASAATDADIDIPVPDGLEYLPFQKAGIAAAKTGNVLLGDEMGLGKTIQALGIINNDESIRKVLIVVPASLRLNWKREAEKWLVADYTIGIAEGNDIPDTNIVIINYDILNRHADVLRKTDWDLVIADESHKLKNGKALRTQAVVGKWDSDPTKIIEPLKAKRKVFLTGTPILNRPIELFTSLHYLYPETWKSVMYYGKRYCGGFQGEYGWDFSGASNLDELQIKLRETVLVRRLKADVLSELPSKTRQIIELPLNGTSKAVKHEQKVIAKYNTLKDRLDMLKDVKPDDYEKAVKQLRSEFKVAFDEISKVRHDTAVAKVPAVVNHINDILEDNSDYKLVVFAHHHDVVNGIVEGIGAEKCVTLIGTDSTEHRQESVDRFQNDSTVQVFVGTIGAAGVGITLTKSSHVVFAELDWVPGNITQAEDRVHRIGQNEAVLIQHLVVTESIDAHLAHTLVSKQAVISKAVDMSINGKSLTQNFIEKDKALVEAAKEKAGKEVRKVEKKRKTKKEFNDKVDMALVELVHLGLNRLAGSCDGARAIDDSGFNKFDTTFGKSLAAQKPEWWSPKQVVCAAKMVIKYKRQLPEAVVEAGYEIKKLVG